MAICLMQRNKCPMTCSSSFSMNQKKLLTGMKELHSSTISINPLAVAGIGCVQRQC